MKKSFVSRFAIVTLVLCLLSVILVFPIACDNDEEEELVEKKAVIILPGIMGSNIVDTTTGSPLWAPIERDPENEVKMWELDMSKDFNKIIKQPGIQKLLKFEKPGGAYEWIEKMKVNADGSVNNPNEAQVINDDGTSKYPKCATYGTLEYYEKTYQYLKANVPAEYEVRMFEYDWRLNNMDSAIALEKFINDHKYTDVVFVAHSMGGVLASTYIARSEENQKKVEKFISLGAPFFGSHKALRVIENPLSLVGDSADMEDMLKAVETLVNTMNGKGSFDKFFGMFMQFAYDLPTIYQLMPYADMANGYVNTDSELKDMGIISIDGKPVKSYEEVYNFMKSRGYINERCINNMIAWQNEQYVEKDGKKVHASMVVDTLYYVGNDLDTELQVNFVNGEMTDCTMSKLGDGTVPLYSATCGLPLTDSRIREFKGVSHGNLSYDDVCLEQIVKDIKGIK